MPAPATALGNALCARPLLPARNVRKVTFI